MGDLLDAMRAASASVTKHAEKERARAAERQVAELREKVAQLEDQCHDLNEQFAQVAAYKEQLAAAQAVIAEMREAIGAWERAEWNLELQEAEAKLIAAMNTAANLDALHEARAAECERLADMLGIPASAETLLREEAAQHRARKEGK